MLAALAAPAPALAPPERPLCRCGLHSLYGRQRFGALNNKRRTEAYAAAVTSILGEANWAHALVLGDGPLIPLLAAGGKL